MSERRIDPFTGRGVVIAEERYGLGATKPGGLPVPSARCPFCPGHESDAEPTIASWPEPGPWRIRVVRNKFPVVRGADGDHEVGIDAREHDVDLDGLEVAHVAALLGVYRGRVRALEARPGIASVVPFRNRGRRAGSSQPHPHSQIVALGWVPSEVALRWDRARAYLAERGAPLHRAELERELASPRALDADPHAVAFCPRAPSRPWEIRIAPRAPSGGFGSASDAELASVGAMLVRWIGRLRALTPVGDYNLVVQNPPVGASGPAAAWHIDVLPRTGGDAGFELAGGEMIVVVAPEEAAGRLR